MGKVLGFYMKGRIRMFGANSKVNVGSALTFFRKNENSNAAIKA